MWIWIANKFVKFHPVHTYTYSYYTQLFLAGLTTTLTWSSNKLAAAQS